MSLPSQLKEKGKKKKKKEKKRKTGFLKLELDHGEEIYWQKPPHST